MRGLRQFPVCVVTVALLIFATGMASAQTETVLIPDGAVWKYLDDGSDQGMAWRDTAAVDSLWNSGPAQLGYGDGDEATVVSYGLDPDNKYVTTYFRHSFELADPSPFSYLRLSLLRDDGAIIYLNGAELKRSNMPSDPIDYQTLAASTVGSAAEDTFYDYYVESSDLKAGTNVVAVEIHQRSVTSSDISFDLEVTGLDGLQHPTRKAPYLIYTGDNTEMLVLWQLWVSDTCTIEWGLDESYGMGSVVTHEHGGDYQHKHKLQGLMPSTTYYYRVTARDDVFTNSFTTAPSVAATDVSFLVYGDTRTYPADHNEVAQGIIAAYTAEPALHTMLVCVGDMVSSGDDESDWDTEFFDLSYTNIRTMLGGLAYQACRGNHEGSGIIYGKYFPYPYISPCYWSFDYGPAHFTLVDQYVSYTPGSPQYDWIVADLEATTRPWKFLVFHMPGWGAGGHSNEIPVQTYLQPLCLEHDVAAVFAGHNHYYSRAVVDGVQHVTTGGGGAPLYAPNPSYPNVVATAQLHHFCTVRIDDDDLYFTAISAAGDTIDEFSLIGGTSVEDPGDGAAVGEILLRDAFPNPFNPVTTIAFSIPAATVVELDIVNVRGEVVATLVDGACEPGEQRLTWDGTDDLGRSVSSGVYFYRLRADGQQLSRKMVLLK